MSVLAVLADSTDVGGENLKAGPIAIVVIIVLCVACFILFRSMTKHLRRVREDFPEAETLTAPTDQPADGSHDVADDVADEPVASGPARPAPKSRAQSSDE